jgi:hypothetical protein
LTLALISALALLLVSLSMAPYLRISSIRVWTKSLSEDPKRLALRKLDFLPMKNCAAVEPLSNAGVLLYSVSVATSLCLHGRFRMGFGDAIWLRRVCPCVAPLLPY